MKNEDLVGRLTGSAKAFRKYPIFTADGDPVLLTAQAEELEEASALLSTYRKVLEEIESEIVGVLGAGLKGRTHDVWQRAENAGMRGALSIVRKHRQALSPSASSGGEDSSQSQPCGVAPAEQTGPQSQHSDGEGA